MKKDTINVRALTEKYQVNCNRLMEIADLAEAESRDLTDAEKEERAAIERANSILSMKIQAATAQTLAPAERQSPTAYALAVINRSGRVNFEFRRDLDVNLSDSFADTGVFPLNIQELLGPLYEGLVLSQVGIPFLSGLAGSYVWPTYEAVEAKVVNEGVALTDTAIEISKLTANPQRIGIAVPVTRESLEQSAGVIENIITTVIPQSVAALINKLLLSPTQVVENSNLVGPFVGCDTYGEILDLEDSAVLKHLNKMKAQVLKTGIDGSALCWIMTKSQKATLECTPKDAGSGIMICENDKVCGLPVFTSQYITEECIGLGDWRYQPMGLFGTVSFITDPYTQARANAIDFVFNANFGTVTLRPEAFLKAAVGAGD